MGLVELVTQRTDTSDSAMDSKPLPHLHQGPTAGKVDSKKEGGEELGEGMPTLHFLAQEDSLKVRPRSGERGNEKAGQKVAPCFSPELRDRLPQ